MFIDTEFTEIVQSLSVEISDFHRRISGSVRNPFYTLLDHTMRHLDERISVVAVTYSCLHPCFVHVYIHNNAFASPGTRKRCLLLIIWWNIGSEPRPRRQLEARYEAIRLVVDENYWCRLINVSTVGQRHENSRACTICTYCVKVAFMYETQ